MKIESLFFAVILAAVLCLGGTLSAATYGGGSGTVENPYEIRTPEQLNTIGTEPNDWDKYFKLMDNIDMSAYTGTQYNIIGNLTTHFTGVFDGNNHVISNLTYENAINYVGLFGAINNAVIKNLSLENVKIGGNDSVGGLVGLNYSGTIISCHITGSIGGNNSIGGLAGWNEGLLISCYSNGSVTGQSGVGGLIGGNSGSVTACYAAGVTGSFNYLGGLAGRNFGKITNCYATGSVIGRGWIIGGLVGDNLYDGSISACYATGKVLGISDVGGLIGYSNTDSVTACFWDIQTTDMATSAGAGGTLGKTTAEMKTVSTFTDAGWDFVGETASETAGIWKMRCEGMNYPKLTWQHVQVGDFACRDGVDTEDLNFYAERWLMNNCTSGNNYCGGADMNKTGTVDLTDFAIFAQHWLEGI